MHFFTLRKEILGTFGLSSRLCRLGLDPNKLKTIYTLPFCLTKDTKLCVFQYKVIHNS